MPEWAFIALGSNLGDRARHLETGIEHLRALPRTSVMAVSGVEETAPLGEEPQGPFLNQMALLRTDLTPRELLEACRRGEALAGRAPSSRWGPRTLDLDVVRHGDAVVAEPDLTVPHPEVRNRPFWIRELAELAPTTFPDDGAALPPWAKVGEARRAHVERVAGLLAAWAMAMEQPPNERRRWLRAAFLHDALRDAPRDTLASHAPEGWDSPALAHGPAAAAAAAADGETDQGVLDAVRYHSVGYAGWDRVGRMLYLADYLEPGRSVEQERRAELAASVPSDPDGALVAVVRDRLSWVLRAGLPIPPESVGLWNALV